MRRVFEALGDEVFDLVVLGGGITGAGVALDAVLRGARVALVDRGDFASGTSSISSKLVHGGLRYLEQGQLGLVYEALHERGRLLRNAPHLVHPLRFIIPFLAQSRVPPWKWRAGLLLYDLLAGSGNLARSQLRSRGWVRRQFPGLVSAGLTGAGEYSDAQMDDARLCLAVIRSAANLGAVVCNYAEVVSLEHASGRVVAARVEDRVATREIRVRGKVFVNCTGPWSDRIRRMAGEPKEPTLAPTKGVHVLLPNQHFPTALLLLHPRDGRVFFVLPWMGKTLLGTTDTECMSGPEDVEVTPDDIDYLLEGFYHHFRAPTDSTRVLGAFVGVRPLASVRPGDPSDRSREWRLAQGPSGLLSVIGGKYTTYRHMAEKTTDAVMRRLGRNLPCRTQTFRLDGAPAGDWSEYVEQATAELSRRYAISESCSRHLVCRHGTRAAEVAGYLARNAALASSVIAGEPDILAELRYARDSEMAILPEDFFLRRTRLGLFQPEILVNPSETPLEGWEGLA